MGIACLSCHSITRTLALSASLPSNTNSPSPQSNTGPKPPSLPVPVPTTRSTTTKSTTTLQPPRKKNVQNKLQQQLDLMRIERAVGAGSYRDYEKPIDQEKEKEKKKKKKVSGFMEEGPVEKKLRETGEWVITKTEGGFRSNGKRILMFSFKWALPIYIFMVFVASGVIKLPFSSQFLDDLLM
ncbi:NAD(P)H dehydrogenase [Salix suchowensis]|nr:NAD(P)H dehydrogenase [Salix suchowensis]